AFVLRSRSQRDSQSVGGKPEAAMPGPASGQARARILIIDNDSEASSNLAELLTRSGYQASVAENGSVAQARLEELRPDLIIMDIMLPDVDGLILCADIKSTSQVPIIVCSATSRRRDRVLALQL